MPGERLEAVEREAVGTWRSTPLALWAGLLAVVLTLAVGLVALAQSWSSNEAQAQRELLDATHVRAAVIEAAATQGYAAAGADLVFDTLEPARGLASTQLVLLGRDGRVRQATRETIEPDTSWAELRVRLDDGPPITLSAALAGDEALLA